MSYSSYSSPFDSIAGYLRRSQMPVTITIIAISAVTFVVNFFAHALVLLFVFLAPPFTILDIFTAFTYPLLNPDFIGTLLTCWMLSWVGGSLERSWGSGKFALFFFGITAVTSLGLFAGGVLLHRDADIIGLWLPLTSLIVAWAALNPMQTVMVYILPVQARWLALFEVGVIYFVTYAGSPILGLFALLGPLVALLLTRYGFMTGARYIPAKGPDLRMVGGGLGKRKRPLDDAGISMSLNPIERFRVWQQRRKLAKLLQSSNYPERDDDRRGK